MVAFENATIKTILVGFVTSIKTILVGFVTSIKTILIGFVTSINIIYKSNVFVNPNVDNLQKINKIDEIFVLTRMLIQTVL